MNGYKLLPCLAGLLLIASCSTFTVGPDRSATQELGPVADPFQQALVDGYKRLGAEQYAEADYSSADIYYRKALDAGTGKAVPLEDPANWSSLAPNDRQQVLAMRPEATAWIESTKRSNPKAAAEQQIKFDCWIEELSEGEYPDAAACRPGPFPPPGGPVVAGANCSDTPQPVQDSSGKLCQEGVIYFAWDRYDLLNPGENKDRAQTVDAQAAVLDLIVRQANAVRPARIDVIGRADASGPEEYNYGLSECRARSVIAALKARGLPSSVEVRTIPLGKTDLIVKTADGVRDPANRVVMVAYQTNASAPLARAPAAPPKKDLFGCGSARHPFPPPK